jgi:nucleoid DNA-binding protein
MEEKVSCNSKLYKQTSLKTGVSPHQVEEFFRVVCNFTEEVISRGGYETVMWPNFGKFKVKPKQVQFLANKDVVPKL